ncbi:MAG: ferredoxin [Eubacteriales bacterium]|nr:ferredoxin [Eubacteriales bacterium]
MKAFVDKDGCISCGLCVNICPDVFQFDEDQKAEAVLDPVPAEHEESAREAADSCPVSVISIE